MRFFKKIIPFSAFLRLIRWQNLIIILFTQQMIHFFLLENIFGTINIKIPFSDKMIHVNQLISHLTGMVFSFFSNYYLHKTFTFKSTGFYDRLKTAIK